MKVNHNNPGLLDRLDQINIGELTLTSNKLNTGHYNKKANTTSVHIDKKYINIYSSYTEELLKSFNVDDELAVYNLTYCYFNLKSKIVQIKNEDNKSNLLHTLEKAHETSVKIISSDIASQLYLIGFSHSNRVYDEYSKLHNRVNSNTINSVTDKIIKLFSSAKNYYLEIDNPSLLLKESIKKSNYFIHTDLPLLSNIIKDINTYLNKRYYGIKSDFLLRNEILFKINKSKLGDYAKSLFISIIDR